MAARKSPAAKKKSSLRLSTGVSPLEYDLEIDVDPGKSNQYRGRVRIQLELKTPQRSIELHACDLKVSAPMIEAENHLQRGTVAYDAKREIVRIEFKQIVPKGVGLLELQFTGKLRKDLRGFYAVHSEGREYAFTQLEATDARRFFPCFDEPSKKARLQLSVITANSNTVIANNPIESTTALSGARKKVTFTKTPRLSSYLYALAVGELESSEVVLAGDTEIRIWHIRGKASLTSFGLEAARESLIRLERYFNLPYPYEKLDLVAVPDFEFGAMENVGAVFFRETLLLCDPSKATLLEKKRLAEVICHELAHMWYGNLVTMAWWDDLWLNEAFATWMAFAIVDDWKPEWKMWNDFQHYRAAALGMDALKSTHPIYTKVRRPEEATENFDLITYEKGASVVKMLEHYLGAVPFRKGVRAYIRKHRESNTVAKDLWDALSEASGEPVEAIANAWITQEGFPLVRIREIEKSGKPFLEFQQERFLAKAKEGSSKDSWPIPWVGRVQRRSSRSVRKEKFLFKKVRDEFPLGKQPLKFLYGNADEAGFFRPLHTDANVAALADSFDSLSILERMGLLGHQWAHVRSGYAPLATFLRLVPATKNETNPDVLKTLRAPLSFIDGQLAAAAGPEIRYAFRTWIIENFGEQLLELGWDSSPDEDLDLRVRRSIVISLLGEVAEWESTLFVARQRCEKYLVDRSSLEANLADAVVTLAARGADASFYDQLLASMHSAKTPQEQRRFMLALADARSPKLIDRTLQMALTEAVPTQDVAALFVRLFQNEAARERTWKFIQQRWKRVEKRLTPMMVSRLIEATPALQTREHQQGVVQFFREHPAPTGVRALKQATERFRLNSAFRRRATPELQNWFEEN